MPTTACREARLELDLAGYAYWLHSIARRRRADWIKYAVFALFVLALLAAAAVGDVNPAVMLAAGILGGGLAAGTHAAKAGSRVLINTSPEPFSNWLASIGEDLAVIAGVWVALAHPWLFLGFMVVFVLLMIWLLPKLWRGIKAVFAKIASLFRRTDRPAPAVKALEDREAPERR